MRIINQTKSDKQIPKRGQVWQPKDPAHHSVIIADVNTHCVHLQYIDSPELTFQMDRATFLKYYTFLRHHKQIPPANTLYNESFFA